MTTMRVAHLLRKYDPTEWGGTETAIHQLAGGLHRRGVESVAYCPALSGHQSGADPLAEAGCVVKRFRACVPIWGISNERKRQLLAIGGNLMSFGLIRSLAFEPGLSLIHSHALGRVGGIGLTVARRRRIPFVVSVHGGVYDLPESLKESFNSKERAGWEWGKPFGFLFRSRQIFDEADAIVSCNEREAALIRERHPGQYVFVQPHGVPAARYQADFRKLARQAFPQIEGRQVLLYAGRIDPVKNQDWLIEQLPALLKRHPRVLLVLAGPCTDEPYGKSLGERIEREGLGAHVLLTGKLPPGDSRLIGLMQEARAVVLSSVSETFGLVILEAWAAGATVISSRTSGAAALVEPGTNGWLFDLKRPAQFHEAVDELLTHPNIRERFAAAGRKRVLADFDVDVLAARMKNLYQYLVDGTHAYRHTA